MYARDGKSWVKHFDFFLLDLIILVIAFYISYLIRHGMWRIDLPGFYKTLCIAMMLIHTVLSFIVEPYGGILRRNRVREFRSVVIHNMEIIFIMIFYMFAVQSSEVYSRMTVLILPFVSITLMTIERILWKSVIIKRSKQDSNQAKILLIADERNAHRILPRLLSYEYQFDKIVGIILCGEETDTEIKGIPVVGTRETMYDYVRENVVDDVLIAVDDEDLQSMASNLMAMGVTIHIAIQNFIDLPHITVNKMNSVPVITASSNVVTLKQILIKRAIDIVVGLIGSFITIILTIFVGGLIKIIDPGPVFFKQVRVGKNGREFYIYKFRSMYMDAEERKAALMERNEMQGLMFKMEDDPRIIGSGPDGTKKGLGYWLRKLSIDEFPQFFNILKGDMSLVGTRPPTLDEYKQYENHHVSRLAIKPGLTGMWQVSGRSDITDFEEVVKLDNYYIENFSIEQDLRIILKTFVVVLAGRGSK